MKVDGILEKKDETQNSNENKIIAYTGLSKTIILGLIGIILLLIPEGVNDLIGRIIGAILTVYGIINIVKYFQNRLTINFISGIIYTAVGMIFIFYPRFFISWAAICLGVFFVILSITKLQVAFTLKQITEYWKGTLVIALVTLALGLLLIFNPFEFIVSVTKLAGALLLLVAILDITDICILRKKISK